MEVGDGVAGLKHGYDAGVFLGVGVGHVHNLEAELETGTSFVTAKFDPDLLFWDHSIMPSELSKPMCVLCAIKAYFIETLGPVILVEQLFHLCYKIGVVRKWSWSEFLPSSLHWEGEQHSFTEDLSSHQLTAGFPEVSLTLYLYTPYLEPSTLYIVYNIALSVTSFYFTVSGFVGCSKGDGDLTSLRGCAGQGFSLVCEVVSSLSLLFLTA